MKNELKKSDFDFEYKGSNLTEKDAIDNGFVQLTGKELLSKISNITVFGDYLMGYKYVTDFYENGNAEGINNVGSHNLGNWVIDLNENTLSIKWNNGWFETITRAYEVNGNIEFYDIETGHWRTTFNKFINWKEE